MSVEIRGAEQLAALSKALKLAADKELQRELTQSLKQAMEPVKAAQRREAFRILPEHGGLNRRVAGTRITTVVRTSARSSGVRLSARARLRRIDEGTVRHPVFGNRRRFVTQQVQPGWFTRPAEDSADETRRALEKAMAAVARKIEKAV